MRYEGTRFDGKCPCMKCTAETGRCVGCHSACNRYLEWTDARKAEKKKIKQAEAKQVLSDDDKLYRIIRLKRMAKNHKLSGFR